MIWIKCIFGLLIFQAITCSPAISHGKNIRIQRSLMGGVVVKDPNDPKYVELAKLSMKKYKTDVGSNQSFIVLQVTSATEQAVAGLVTEIDFYVLQSPGQSLSGDMLGCHSKIFEQKWLNKIDITVNCNYMNV